MKMVDAAKMEANPFFICSTLLSAFLSDNDDDDDAVLEVEGRTTALLFIGANANDVAGARARSASELRRMLIDCNRKVKFIRDVKIGKRMRFQQ